MRSKGMYSVHGNVQYVAMLDRCCQDGSYDLDCTRLQNLWNAVLFFEKCSYNTHGLFTPTSHISLIHISLISESSLSHSVLAQARIFFEAQANFYRQIFDNGVGKFCQFSPPNL